MGKVRVIICWNCGGLHRLDECKCAHDESKIKKACKKMKEERKAKQKAEGKKGKPCTCKWAPPKKGESSRKMIEDKWHNYDSKAKRWVPEEKVTKEAMQANQAQVTQPQNDAPLLQTVMALQSAFKIMQEQLEES
jgi:hypothetical protein